MSQAQLVDRIFLLDGSALDVYVSPPSEADAVRVHFRDGGLYIELLREVRGQVHTFHVPQVSLAIAPRKLIDMQQPISALPGSVIGGMP